MSKLGINGFGRIGRLVLRRLLEVDSPLEVVAINDLTSPKVLAYLLKHDSNYGPFPWSVDFTEDALIVDGKKITVYAEKEAQHIPWKAVGAELIVECTGFYTSAEKAQAHLTAGAKKVLISAPAGDMKTIVYNVNDDTLDANDTIISVASCTTNCIIPVIKLLDDAYGIESGTVTTIHSSMNDQQVIDSWHPDLRRTRAASQSIIPVDTKLAAGITRIFPQFNDRFEAIAVRVPTINVTAIDLSVTVKKPVKASEVNQLLQKAAQGVFHGIVDYTELPLVSIDFNHDPHSAIVDGTQTRVSGAHLIKTLVWCDNEWGFANRMLDTTLAMAAQGFR